MTESTDPYLYQGSAVLKNLREIRDSGRLSRFEAEAATRRIIELIDAPALAAFDTTHIQAIHKHIFQDVYPWAGQFRTVNISKGGQLFGAAAFIETTFYGIFRKLYREGRLKGLDAESFSRRAGFFLGEINAVHPFRDGNGRAQREFIRQLGLQAGYAIDWSRVEPDRMMEASRVSFRTGNSSGLAALILMSLA